LFLLYQKPRETDPVLKIYQRFLKKLAKKGIVKRPSEGPRDFAERVKPLIPQQAGEIEEITAVFIGLRYGNWVGQEKVQQLRTSVNMF